MADNLFHASAMQLNASQTFLMTYSCIGVPCIVMLNVTNINVARHSSVIYIDWISRKNKLQGCLVSSIEPILKILNIAFGSCFRKNVFFFHERSDLFSFWSTKTIYILILLICCQ
jgi:hypothetical protein